MVFSQTELSQIDFSILEAKEVVPKLQEYINLHLEELVIENIIPEIVLISKAINLPQGFIDGIGYEQTGKNRIKVVNRWGTSQKPLAKWFNYGTRDHGPVFKKALHWIDKLTGKDIFARWVHGIPKTNAMEIGIELGKKRFIHNLLLHGREYVIRELDLVE